MAISAILVALVAGWASYSSGQQTRSAARNDGVRGKVDHFDHHVAQCLILGNQNEIAAAKIAQKKGNNEEVKNFADTMVKDHDKFIAELEKFAGHNYRHRDSGGSAAAPERVGAGERRTGTENAAPRSPEGKDAKDGKDGEHHEHLAKFMRIHEELADQCRASVQRELDSKQGKAFDECYMGMQIAAHMKMVDELTVLQRHVTPNFKSILERGRETAQHHLDNAKQVMKDVNDSRTADSKDSAAK
jgi:predicted outer membrane protein